MTADVGRAGDEVRLDRRLAQLILRAATEFADPLGARTPEVVDDLLGELADLFGVSRTRLWLQDPGARRIVPAAAVYRDTVAGADLPIELDAATVARLASAIDEHGGLVPLGPDGPVPELSFDSGGDGGVALGLCIPVRPGLDRGGILALCGVRRPPRGPEEAGAVVALGRMLVGAVVGDEIRQRNEVTQRAAGIGVVLRDPMGRLLDANDSYFEMIGRAREDLLGRTLEEVVVRESVEAVEDARRELSQGRSDVVVVEFEVGEGAAARSIVGYAAPIRLPDGTVRYSVGVARDVTGERRAEQALRRSEARLRSVVENVPALIVRTDAAGRIEFASHRARNVVGLDAGQLVGAGVDALGPTHPPGQWSVAVDRAVETREIVEFEAPVRVGDERRWIWARLAPEIGDDGVVGAVTLYALDVTPRKTVEIQLERAARHDALTGLLNRSEFTARLTDRLAEAPAGDRERALMFVDLDRFKHINDSMGHRTGDAVLVSVAGRIESSARAGSLVGRIGGDEFVVLTDVERGAAGADAAAQQLRKVLEEPMEVEGRDVLTSVCIGVAMATDGVEAEELVHAADLAMYAAKRAGRNRVVVHTPELESKLGLRSTLETELRGAVRRGELVVAYQPEVDLATRELVGVEALVRWDHPERGRLGAADFVEIAEDSGLLVEIGEYALRGTWADLAEWSPLPDGFQARVNLSAVQLASAVELLHLLDELDASGPLLPRLCLELTETSLLADPDTARVVLESVRERGVSVAIDDFGTGYGGFTYVKSFPVDLLKIDRSFVTDVAEDAYDRAIVEAIVGLAGSLDLAVSAEGIESQQQAEVLLAMGCRRGQGFLYGPAVSAGEVARMLGAPDHGAARVPGG